MLIKPSNLSKGSVCLPHRGHLSNALLIDVRQRHPIIWRVSHTRYRVGMQVRIRMDVDTLLRLPHLIVEPLQLLLHLSNDLTQRKSTPR